MYLAYSLLLSLGLLVLIPHFLFQALAHGKYVEGLRQRFGLLPARTIARHPVIWLHCVSVGETQAARPLVDQLKRQFPHHALVVSTITRTGQKLARDVFAKQAEEVFYFPFDWRWTARRALSAINPDAVLIMETELWPNFLRECESREIPVALVNGRISRQSFRRYSAIKFFLERMLRSLTVAVMQSDVDAGRLRDLGMPVERLHTAGNLKFDAKDISMPTEQTLEIRERFGLRDDVSLILAASTHAPEEQIILDSFKQLRGPARLMLAPRHPERFQEVASLIRESGLSWARRTDAPSAGDADAAVILLDTIGELPSTYALATVVFVGGSIVDRGGHNVLEPAAAGVPVVTGAHTHNFHAIVDQLNKAEALVQLPPVEGARASAEASAELAQALTSLLADADRRAELATRAKQLIATNRGAAERTINLIAPLLSPPRQNSSNSNPLLTAKAQTS
ncbi:MAG TPA: 3-deoxy-D-manno-octulosonic acid transferase [Pyrinomonadaceae bacterium]|nr:3-deoxy-D-manno-octulosonic acid transferase [Pyrinomonadaceae bacterium]